MDAKASARQTLEQVSALAFSSFPQTILPNPLISEMDSLGKAAGLTLPRAPNEEQSAFLADVQRQLESAAMDAPRVVRLRPALIGLAAIARGERFDATGRAGEGRRLLGWTVGKHWLFEEV